MMVADEPQTFKTVEIGERFAQSSLTVHELCNSPFSVAAGEGRGGGEEGKGREGRRVAGRGVRWTLWGQVRH